MVAELESHSMSSTSQREDSKGRWYIYELQLGVCIVIVWVGVMDMRERFVL